MVICNDRHSCKAHIRTFVGKFLETNWLVLATKYSFLMMLQKLNLLKETEIS